MCYRVIISTTIKKTFTSKMIWHLLPFLGSLAFLSFCFSFVYVRNESSYTNPAKFWYFKLLLLICFSLIYYINAFLHVWWLLYIPPIFLMWSIMEQMQWFLGHWFNWRISIFLIFIKKNLVGGFGIGSSVLFYRYFFFDLIRLYFSFFYLTYSVLFYR